MNKRITFTAAVVFLAGLQSLAAVDESAVRFVPGSAVQIQAVGAALNFVGTPYRYGGFDATGMDCSGLVFAVYREFYPYRLPRTSRELFNMGTEVTEPLTAGDLVFFNTTGDPASHVGIYIGDGNFVHSASDGASTGVIISSLSENYYKSRYTGARRLLEWSIPTFEIRLGEREPSTYTHARVMADQPVGFLFFDAQQDTRQITALLTRDGEPYIVRRSILPAGEMTSFWFWAVGGTYSLAVDGNKVLSFKVAP